MSYSIAQDTEETKLAVALQRNAEISTIRLIESNAKCRAPLSADLTISFSAEFHPESAECVGRNLNISTHFCFKIINDADKDEMIVLQCVMGAEYELAEDFEPSSEQIKAFKEGPAIFNCWPYFREYVQTTVARMNYPPPTIPFLWLESKKPPMAEPTVTTETAKKSAKDSPSPKRHKKEAPITP